MGLQEALDLLTERKAAHAHIVDLNALFGEPRARLAYRSIAAAERDDRGVDPRLLLDHRGRHHSCRRKPLFPQPVNDNLVLLGIFGVAAVLIVSRATREVGALGAHARQGALRDAI